MLHKHLVLLLALPRQSSFPQRHNSLPLRLPNVVAYIYMFKEKKKREKATKSERSKSKRAAKKKDTLQSPIGVRPHDHNMTFQHLLIHRSQIVRYHWLPLYCTYLCYMQHNTGQ